MGADQNSHFSKNTQLAYLSVRLYELYTARLKYFWKLIRRVSEDPREGKEQPALSELPSCSFLGLSPLGFHLSLLAFKVLNWLCPRRGSLSCLEEGHSVWNPVVPLGLVASVRFCAQTWICPVSLLFIGWRGERPHSQALSAGATPYSVLRLNMSRLCSNPGLVQAGIPSSWSSGLGLSEPTCDLFRVLGEMPPSQAEESPRAPSLQCVVINRRWLSAVAAHQGPEWGEQCLERVGAVP